MGMRNDDRINRGLQDKRNFFLIYVYSISALNQNPYRIRFMMLYLARTCRTNANPKAPLAALSDSALNAYFFRTLSIATKGSSTKDKVLYCHINWRLAAYKLYRIIPKRPIPCPNHVPLRIHMRSSAPYEQLQHIF